MIYSEVYLLSFSDLYTPTFANRYKKLSKIDQKRIIQLIDDLKKNPKLGKELPKFHGYWSAKKGYLRIIFSIDWNRQEIIFRSLAIRKKLR
ncbi:MAG: type II toxin-antitoxin system RelE family toxin [Promethearchaeota archaeon]